MKLILKICLVTFAAILSNSNASTHNWGAYTEAFDAETARVDIDGGFGFNSAFSSLGTNIEAQSTLDGASFTPVLSARSSQSLNNVPGSLAFGYALGMQSYTYTGTGPKTYTLNIALNGAISGDASVRAQVDLRTNISTFAEILAGGSDCTNASPGSINLRNLPAVVCGTDFGSSDLVISSGNTSLFDELIFTLNEGDTFILLAQLNATSYPFGSADASNAFTMNFDDDSNLVLSSVPLPAPVWLFVSGLIALASIKLRKNR